MIAKRILSGPSRAPQEGSERLRPSPGGLGGCRAMIVSTHRRPGAAHARHANHRRPSVTDLKAAKSSYTDYLGLTEEEFNLGWVARYTSPETGINLQLMTRDATAPEDPVISVKVDDVEAAHAEAQERGYEIMHPLTTEEWGVTRFFVRAPDGNVLNVVQHRD